MKWPLKLQVFRAQVFEDPTHDLEDTAAAGTACLQRNGRLGTRGGTTGYRRAPKAHALVNHRREFCSCITILATPAGELQSLGKHTSLLLQLPAFGSKTVPMLKGSGVHVM